MRNWVVDPSSQNSNFLPIDLSSFTTLMWTAGLNMFNTEVLYNKLAIDYNSTRKADTYITGMLRDLLSPKQDGVYLDIGCGTGNYTIALSNYGISFYGIDPSQKMLEIANQNSNSVRWLIGSAENIPAEDNFFDGGIAILTIHHWLNIERSLKELNRVLKFDSHFVIFTSLPEQMNGYWLNHYFPKMMADSQIKMPDLKSIEEESAKTGFKIISAEKYDVRSDLQDRFLYSAKLNPLFYLNEKTRSGISSFVVSANSKEVKIGLKRLKDDLNDNRFESIKNKFDNDLGDYVFITLNKTN